MLKKLPGLTVNSKGEITAYGERVQRVFVDGEEFFGDDPTIATKNISAKAVDKVQVFDKTSKNAELTGIDDGDKYKAINLTLKEEYKKGYFGKINSGVGLSPFLYDHSVLGQVYKGKTKFGVFGILSNIGTVGLSYQDRNSLTGGSGSNIIMDGDNVMIYNNSDNDDGDWNGQYSGKGIPYNIGGGTAFSTKLFKEKLLLSANYSYSNRKLDIEEYENENTFSGIDTFQSITTNISKKNVKTNSGNFKLEYKLDSMTNIEYNLTLSKKANQNDINEITNNSNSGLKTLFNQRNTNSDYDLINQKHALNIVRKFKKIRRSLILNTSYSDQSNTGINTLQSLSNNLIDTTSDVFDLHKVKNNGSNLFENNLTYSEPLSKLFTLSVSHKLRIQNQDNSLISYNKFGDTIDYINPVDSLSNVFNYQLNTQGGGTNLNFKTEKITWNIGVKYEHAEYNLLNKINDSNLDYAIERWIPNANFNYKFNRTSGIRFNYNGSTRPPSINQIQPINDNSNPLNIVVGNPELLQEYSQNMNVSYNFWHSLQGNYFWTNLSFSNTFNSITSNINIDPSGQKVTSYLNVDGNYYLNMFMNYGFKIQNIFDLSFGFFGSQSQMINYLNGKENKVKYNAVNPNISFSIDFPEKFEIDIRYDPTWNFSSGGQIQNAGNYHSYDINSDLKFYILKNLVFENELNYTYQGAQSNLSQNFSQLIMNSFLSYYLDKDKNWTLSAGVYDLFNQNRGFTRNFTNNTLYENRYNNIKRYGGLRIIYNFKNKIEQPKDSAN